MDSRRMPASKGPGSGRERAALHDQPGRWLTSARFLLRSLNLRGPAFLLALLALTIGTTVIATVLHLKAGLGEKMSRQLRAYGPNLLVVPANTGASTLDATVIDRLPGLLAVGASAAPALLAEGLVGESGATFVGTDFARLIRLYPGWKLEPAEGAFAPGASGCVVGASLASRAGLRPGSMADLRLGIDSFPRRVDAVLSTGENEDEQVFLPLALVQEKTRLDGRVSFVALSIEGGIEAVEGAAVKLQEALPGVRARPLSAIALAEGAILNRMDRMMLLLTLVILALTGLCLVTTLLAMVVERESEIGLARAIGAGDGEIFRMFLGEVGILGLLGAGFGIALGALLVRLVGKRLFGAAIEPSLSVIPVVLLISVVICLISVFIPLRRALRIQPAAVLRGD